MTARSERRDLEMAVIDAAVRWKCGIANKWRDAAYGDIAQELSDAVVAYCEHGLAAPSQARTGLRAPDTSHEAGEWMKQFALTDAGLVFRTIYFVWRSRGGGLTTDEVERKLNRAHQSISARVSTLKDNGWLVDSGERRETRSGRLAIVYMPTAAAIAAVNAHGLPIVVSVP